MRTGVWVGSGRRMALVAAVVAILAGGCNPLPKTVAARRLQPIAVGSVRRIAILPFTSTAAVSNRSEPGAEPLPEPPAETVSRAVRSAMEHHGQWELVDDLTVGEALRQLYGERRAPTPEEARAVGKVLRADAVLRGQVTTFEERIGTELAAKRPAHVVFAVELLRIPNGEALWQAEYAEQQQSLSENLWNLPGFVRAGGTWVRAGELAAIGADQVVTRLHETLYGPPPRSRTRKRR